MWYGPHIHVMELEGAKADFALASFAIFKVNLSLHGARYNIDTMAGNYLVLSF